MAVIDDEGRLFGVVNVIDALAIVLVIAVVLVGTTLVFSGGSDAPDTETVNVTLDLGTQPDFLITALNEGDTFVPEQGSRLVITDVHLSPDDNQTKTLVRLRLEGPGQRGTISYDGAPPRLGRSLVIRTDTYQASGRIIDIGGADTVDTETTSVLLRTTVSPEDARALIEDTQLRVGGQTFGSIEEVAPYETANSSRRLVFVQLDLQTYVEANTRFFGSASLQRGSSLTIPLEGGVLTGEIERVGSGLSRESTSVLIRTIVDAETAAEMRQGDVYRVLGRSVAVVESVTIYGTANADRKLAYVGLRLSTVAPGQRPRFGTRAVEVGSTVPFHTSEYKLTGEVQRVGATAQRGIPVSRQVVLQLRNVRPETARSVEPGAIETTGGQTIARITEVDRENATVVLTSDDGNIFQREHPTNQDLTISAEFTVRETATGVTFKGRPIEEGGTVVLDLGDMTVQLTVVSL